MAVQNYITRLKDCIVGTVNWLYETELYFGKKGSEIRTFGWVLLILYIWKRVFLG